MNERLKGMGGWRRKKLFPVILFCLLFGIGGEDPMAAEGEKVHIGLVEDVILLPWKVKLPARIDTGAALSSLDARDIKVENNMVSFKLPPRYKGLQLTLPLADLKSIRSADARERRPVVEMDLCIGPKHFRALVTLNDRSKVRYPLLIGRNILEGRFVIDCMKSNCAPPSCPEEGSE
jgi:hypothetical protein